MRERACKPRSARGWNVLWFKWSIRCGNCPATFRAKIPYVDHPTLQCPNCGVWNELDLLIAR